MNQRNNRRNRGGRNYRGGFDQADGAGTSHMQRQRMGFESVMGRNFPDRGRPYTRGASYLRRAGLPLRGRAAGGGRGGVRDHNFKQGQIHRVDNLSDSTWSKVTVVRGRMYGKEFIVRELSNYVDGKFQPVLFKFEHDTATFFVDNPDAAAAIRTASRRIDAPNGQKVIINVNPTAPPYIALETSDVEILKTVLDKRYDASTNHMNLSDFINTPGIENHGAQLSLNRNNVMMTVVTLLGDACPSLKSIDLSNNRMRFLDYFGCLNFRCPNIVSVSLANNLIETTNELEKMSFWELTELNLDNNPLCIKFRDQPSYISAVRKYFPTLTRLDGFELKPTFKTGIENDLSTSSKLPPIKEGFLVNDVYKQICGTFVAQYFPVFDDNDRQNRQNLLDAYENDAVFTFSAINLSDAGHSASRGPAWQELIRSSHNIKKMEFWSRHRAKMVQNGRLAIVSFFCSHFPSTRHDPSTFVMDVSFATDSLICLNVNGLFKEANALETDFWRYFTRIFLLVPRNNGVAIINDEMFVSTLSAHEETVYRRQIEEVKITSSSVGGSVVQSNASPASSVVSQPAAVVVPVQQDMQISHAQPTEKEILIRRFVEITKMKPEWAEKCLIDCEWNFEQAGHVFNGLMQANQIPKDAFQ